MGIDPALKLLCERKSQESESEEEGETSGFMKVMFNEDGTARSKLLSHLGFSQPAEESNSVQNDVTEQVNDLGLQQSISGYKESALFATDNGEDFLNNLPSPKADTPVVKSEGEVVGDSVMESHQEIDGQEESSDPSFDDAVQRALVVGDYKGAVARCISANRLADALVIAHVGGVSLWESTRDQYLKTSRSPYLKVVSEMVNNDRMSIANTRPLQSWKETLALFCTFAQTDEWTLLCKNLAARLVSADDTTAATLCNICAGNIDKTVEIWSKNLSAEHDGKSYVDRLQDLMEKTIVIAFATGQKQFSDSLCELIEKYSEVLASQGLLMTVMEYLNLLGTEELSAETTILCDRIARSTEPEKEIENAGSYDNSHSQGRAAYTEQINYSATNIQPTTIPGSQYGDHYPQSPTVPVRTQYASPTFQPVPQPNTPQPAMFILSPAPPVPVGNFPPPPVNTQPNAKFVPANPPALRNAGQYQQPTTLDSQLYPGHANHGCQPGLPGMHPYGPNASQIGPTTGQVISRVVAPAPQSIGFMPKSKSGVQRPGMNPVQSPSPSPPPPELPPVTPAAPPPTVQTVETSNVPGSDGMLDMAVPVKEISFEGVEAHSETEVSSGKAQVEDSSREDVKLEPEGHVPDLSTIISGEKADDVSVSCRTEISDSYIANLEGAVNFDLEVGGVEDVEVQLEGAAGHSKKKLLVQEKEDTDCQNEENAFKFLVTIPTFDEKNLEEQIRLAKLQVDEKTKLTEQIQFLIQETRVSRQFYGISYEDAIDECKSTRKFILSKRMEIESLQPVINNAKNALCIHHIHSMEYTMRHETLPSMDGKQFICEIKNLKKLANELSCNVGSQYELMQVLQHGEESEERLKFLRKELDMLKRCVLKAEATAAKAGKLYIAENIRVKELQALYTAADDVREAAYDQWQNLIKESNKIKYFTQFKDAAAVSKNCKLGWDINTFHGACMSQVESFMELWNSDPEIRRDYMKTNEASNIRRFKNLDCRSLG